MKRVRLQGLVSFPLITCVRVYKEWKIRVSQYLAGGLVTKAPRERVNSCHVENRKEKEKEKRKRIIKAIEMPKLYYTPSSCGAANFIVAHVIGRCRPRDR